MPSFSPMTPDDFEKISRPSQYSSSPPILSPTVDEGDWYLKKRASNSSSKSTERKSLTPLPPSVDISLAILTSGLSVAAFHAVKSISDRRAAKRALAHDRQYELHRADSMLVPSSMPEQSIPTSEYQANSVPIAELDSTPTDAPPAYSAGFDAPLVEKV